MSPTQTWNPIYDPHKAFNFSDKGIPSFSVWKLQMKLELKDSSNIHWESFELWKYWLDYSIFVKIFVLSVCKNKVLFQKKKGLTYFQNFWLISVTKLIFKVTWVTFASDWINIKHVRKAASVAPPTQTTWPQKRPFFAGSHNLFEIRLNKPKLFYCQKCFDITFLSLEILFKGVLLIF